MIVVSKDVRGFRYHRFFAAEPISDWPAGIAFTFRGKHRDGLPAGAVGFTIVSDRVRRVIREFARDDVDVVQFLPVTASRESGEPLGIYWTVRVLREIEALDRDHTTKLFKEPIVLLN